MNKALPIIVIAVVITAFTLFLIKGKSSPPQNTQVQQKSQTEASKSPVQNDTSNQSQAQNTITLTEAGFVPSTLTVKAGTKVVWVNNGGGVATVNSDPHPVHTDYPPLNLGQFDNGQSLSLTFDKPGSFGYHNHLNPSQRGTIIVQ